MTLSNLLHDARVSIEIPTSLKSLEVEQSVSVCPISFYPWLRTTAFAEAISELDNSKMDPGTFIFFDRDVSGYKVSLKGGLKKMDIAKNLSLVYMTPEEISEAKASGKKIAMITLGMVRVLSDNFYGGYNSGTAAAGQVPNVVVLNEN